MLKERRKSERTSFNGYVQIQIAPGAPPCECRLTNVSDGGVRLYVENCEIGEEFVLWLPGEGRGRRTCRVVWRLGPELGAEFVD